MSLFSWLIQKISRISVYLPTKQISKWSLETEKSGGSDTGRVGFGFEPRRGGAGTLYIQLDKTNFYLTFIL